MTLVLLPGLHGTSDLFDPLIAKLNSPASILALDYPDDETLSYADYVNLVREKLPKSEPYVLLAESFSGPIAIQLASEQPQGMAGLVLCCTFPSNPRPYLSWARQLLRFIPFGHLPHAPMVYALLGLRPSTDVRLKLISSLRNLRPAIVHARLKAVLNCDNRAELRKLNQPLLYLQASNDVLVPSTSGSIILEACRHAQLVQLIGPHGLLQAKPDAAAVEILSFMARLSTQPKATDRK